MQQVLTHGTVEDVRQLDLDEAAREIDYIHLPADVENLWLMFLETRHE